MIRKSMQPWQFKKLENAYYHAKSRCCDKRHPRYLDWGGRGIKFNFANLRQFINYIGIPENTTDILDRINNDGHYEIGNVRWTTTSISSLNKRIAKNNSSGVKGVSQRKNGDWSAQAWKNGKQIYLYQGKSFLEACNARQMWEVSVGPNLKDLDE